MPEPLEKPMSAPLQVPALARMSDYRPTIVNDELALRRREVEAKSLATLLLRTAEGDQTSFASLYDATSARIYGTVLQILRSPAHSEETLQDIYLEVWNNASQFDPVRGSAMAWMVTLAHRRAIDRGSRDHDSVVEEVVTSIEAVGVARCLDTLTPKQREAINLAYYRGLSYREVADQLSTSLPTTKSRIRDGLIALKKCLELT